MKFEYRVRNQQGQIKTGIMEAEYKNIVIERLLEQGYYITSLKEKRQSGNYLLDFKLIPSQKVKTRDLVIFTRQLSSMLAAGLSILRCLKILEEQTSSKRLKAAVLKIEQDIEAGQALWEAVAKHPDIFSGIYISMIKAGEMGGVLEAVLDRLCFHLEREQKINSKIKAASIYPMFVSVFAILVVIFIITFILPMFVSMFQSSGAPLPLPTRILLGVSDFLKKWWAITILGVIAISFLLKQWGKTPGGRFFYDNLYLHIPVIGKTISQMIVGRFALTMGTLVKSGIPVIQALEAMEDVVGNVVVGRALARARISINEGQTITKPLVETGVFDPMVTQMISVGEETGSLDEILMRISDYYERELMYTVDAMMAIVEPMLILLVALLVGGIIIAILMPMFDMMNLVGA